MNLRWAEKIDGCPGIPGIPSRYRGPGTARVLGWDLGSAFGSRRLGLYAGVPCAALTAAVEFFLDPGSVEAAELLRDVSTAQGGGSCKSRPDFVGESPTALAALLPCRLGIPTTTGAVVAVSVGLVCSHEG